MQNCMTDSRSLVQDRHELQQEPAEDEQYRESRQSNEDALSPPLLRRVPEHENQRGPDDI
jgi:hypothetical protein